MTQQDSLRDLKSTLKFCWHWIAILCQKNCSSDFSGTGDNISRVSNTLIQTSVCDKYSGSIKITTHLDHISHCETESGTNSLNRWTYRVFIIILAAIRLGRPTLPIPSPWNYQSIASGATMFTTRMVWYHMHGPFVLYCLFPERD